MDGLNKKGLMVYWFIFGCFVAAAMFFLLFSRAFADEPITYKGQLQFGMLRTYSIADGTLAYLDESAIYAGRHVAVDLAERGGFYKDDGCGKYLGHALWNNEQGSCIPDYKNEFKAYLDKVLNEYLKAFPYDKLPLGVIDFDFQETRLIGRGMQDIEYNIFPTKSSRVGVPLAGHYYFSPSFNVDFGYDINEYELIKSYADRLVFECKEKPNLDNCIKKEIETFKNPDWALGLCEGETVNTVVNKRAFCIISDYKLWVYDADSEEIVERPVQYQISLYFGKTISIA